MDQQAAESTGCASLSLFLVRHIFCVQLTCTTDVSSCAAREVQLQKIQWSKSNNSASSETHYSFYNSVIWANLGFEVTVMWIRGSSAYPKIMLIFKIWRKKSANWRSFDFIDIFNIFTDRHKIIIWVCIGVDHLIFDPLVTEKKHSRWTGSTEADMMSLCVLFPLLSLSVNVPSASDKGVKLSLSLWLLEDSRDTGILFSSMTAWVLSNVVIFQVKQAVSLFLCSSYTKTEQSVDPLMEVACNSSSKQLSHQQFEHELKHDACSAELY